MNKQEEHEYTVVICDAFDGLINECFDEARQESVPCEILMAALFSALTNGLVKLALTIGAPQEVVTKEFAKAYKYYEEMPSDDDTIQ